MHASDLQTFGVHCALCDANELRSGVSVVNIDNGVGTAAFKIISLLPSDK